MPVFIVALFTIVKRWKPFKYPPIHEWIHKMWYIHSVEYYLGIKRHKALIHATTQMYFENHMLNAMSDTKGPKKKSHDYSYLQYLA